jgi:hypothetical protein
MIGGRVTEFLSALLSMLENVPWTFDTFPSTFLILTFVPYDPGNLGERFS